MCVGVVGRRRGSRRPVGDHLKSETWRRGGAVGCWGAVAGDVGWRQGGGAARACRFSALQTCGDGGATPETENWDEFRFGGVRFEDLMGHPGGASCEGLAGATHLSMMHTWGMTEGGARGRIPRKAAPRGGPGRARGAALREEQKRWEQVIDKWGCRWNTGRPLKFDFQTRMKNFYYQCVPNSAGMNVGVWRRETKQEG